MFTLYCIVWFIVVCNAGYYKNGSDCELCTGNTIKSKKGDAADCNNDTACDGTKNVPNSGHTACGKNINTLRYIEMCFFAID